MERALYRLESGRPRSHAARTPCSASNAREYWKNRTSEIVLSFRHPRHVLSRAAASQRSGRQPIPLWNSRIVHDIQRLADLGLSSFNLASDMSRYNSGDTITRWPDDGADLMSEGHDISPERALLVGGAANPYDQLPFFGRVAGCLRRK